MRQLLYLLIVLVVYCDANKPWYHTVYEETSHSLTDLDPDVEAELKQHSVCFTTLDCEAGFSCFYATLIKRGYCLRALKPNETDCIIDDQCKRACESTHCDRSQTPSRCLCDNGSHFLFNKCCKLRGKTCPQFAYPEPRFDSNGFSECVLRTDTNTALQYMRRHRRELRNSFC
uniref:TIL domain-containing protein n=1 Tax=Syphacia muris TaxID=451379 RepID=A0A0N5AP25_9BILA